MNALTQAPPPRAPEISLHPLLEKLLNYEHDPLRIADLCEIFGAHRNSIRELLRSGVIPNSTAEMRTGRLHGKFSRRSATKAAVIAWLWNSQHGDRALMRALLQARAPKVLAVLEAQGRATDGGTSQPENVSLHPVMRRAQNLAQSRAASEAARGQRFFSFVAEHNNNASKEQSA